MFGTERGQDVWHFRKGSGCVALLGQVWKSGGGGRTLNYEETQVRQKRGGAAARTKVRDDRKAGPTDQ